MGKKLMTVTVRGKEKVWTFPFYGDPKYMKDWEDDELEVFEVVNMIPVWVVDCGLVRPWCFLQDLFNFKNPFKQ